MSVLLNHLGQVWISALSSSTVSESLKSGQFEGTPIDGPADYVLWHISLECDGVDQLPVTCLRLETCLLLCTPFHRTANKFLQFKQCLGSQPHRNFDPNNDDGLFSTAGVWCDLCITYILPDLHSRYIGPKARFKDPDLQLELDLVYLTDRVCPSWASRLITRVHKVPCR